MLRIGRLAGRPEKLGWGSRSLFPRTLLAALGACALVVVAACSSDNSDADGAAGNAFGPGGAQNGGAPNGGSGGSGAGRNGFGASTTFGGTQGVAGSKSGTAGRAGAATGGRNNRPTSAGRSGVAGSIAGEPSM